MYRSQTKDVQELGKRCTGIRKKRLIFFKIYSAGFKNRYRRRQKHIYFLCDFKQKGGLLLNHLF